MTMKHLAAMAGVVLAAGLAVGQELLPDARYLKPGADSNNWTLTVNVSIQAYSERDAQGMPLNDVFKFDRAAVVFPLIAGTASSRTDAAKVAGAVTFDNRPASKTFTVLTGYPAGTRLGRWDLTEKTGRQMELEVAIPVTSWETVFDEAAASTVPWPSGAWPPAAQAALQPEWYIDFGPDDKGSTKPYDKKPIIDLLAKWTAGKDPRSVTPVVLAKVLAGQVVGYVQTSGNGLNANSLSQMEGISLQGAPLTALKGKGTEFDAVTLLVALYRQAGLPARLVVGYEAEDPANEKLFKQRSDWNSLRVWAEFALFDEKAKTLTWVPVDVVRRRRESSQAPPWDKPWQYFGTHDELDSIVPFAFQFHPPTTVRAYGSPAFWGWMVMPEPPGRAVQAIRFRSMMTPIRGDDPKKPADDRGRKSE